MTAQAVHFGTDNASSVWSGGLVWSGWLRIRGTASGRDARGYLARCVHPILGGIITSVTVIWEFSCLFRRLNMA